MRKYCKAYKLGDLRKFPDWQKLRNESEDELSDQTICFLWDDYVVVKSPIVGGTLFDAVTPAWKSYCQKVLRFEIPNSIQLDQNA